MVTVLPSAKVSVACPGGLAGGFLSFCATATAVRVIRATATIHKRLFGIALSCTISRCTSILFLLLGCKVHLGHRRPANRLALEQRHSGFIALGPIVNGKAPQMIRRSAPHADASICAILAQNVIAHIDILHLGHVAVEVANDAL